MVVVSGRAEEPARDVLPGEDGDHAGDGQRLVLADLSDMRVRVRRSEDFQVQRALHGDVQGVAGVAGDDGLAEGVGEARAKRLPGDVLFGLGAAVNGVLDRAVAGAPAQVALEDAGQSSRASPVKLAAVMIMPAVQKPHWNAWASRNACCMGWSSPSRASPSIVVTSRSAARNAGMRQLWTGSRRARPCRRRSRPDRTPSSRQTSRVRAGTCADTGRDGVRRRSACR